MSPRYGRPKIENPKSKLLQIRMDDASMAILDECAEKKDATRSDIVREGIMLIWRSLNEEQGEESSDKK